MGEVGRQVKTGEGVGEWRSGSVLALVTNDPRLNPQHSLLAINILLNLPGGNRGIISIPFLIFEVQESFCGIP